MMKERAGSHKALQCKKMLCGAGSTVESPGTEGTPAIESGGRMLKEEEDRIVKAEGRQLRWLSWKLVLPLVVALVWLNFQKWGK